MLLLLRVEIVSFVSVLERVVVLSEVLYATRGLGRRPDTAAGTRARRRPRHDGSFHARVLCFRVYGRATVRHGALVRVGERRAIDLDLVVRCKRTHLTHQSSEQAQQQQAFQCLPPRSAAPEL